METGNEKVCKRCATLNDSRSLVCVRCGNELDETGEQKYDILKKRMMPSTLFVILFSIIFAICSYGLVFYVGPWFYDKFSSLGQTFIFDFYNNPKLMFLLIELAFTISISIINYVVVVLILEVVIGSKLLKKSKTTITTLSVYIFMLLIIGGMIIKKYSSIDIALLEYLISTVMVFPYIKKKILKRSA